MGRRKKQTAFADRVCLLTGVGTEKRIILSRIAFFFYPDTSAYGRKSYYRPPYRIPIKNSLYDFTTARTIAGDVEFVVFVSVDRLEHGYVRHAPFAWITFVIFVELRTFRTVLVVTSARAPY